jgi:hypothetical protein
MGNGDMKRYTDCLKKILVSSAQRTRFRLHPHHIQAFVHLHTAANLITMRDVCMIMVGTVGACRKSELIAADVCDWVEGRDRDICTGSSLGAILNVRRQKNALDPRCKRFAYGDDPALCVVGKMQAYMNSAGLGVQQGCQKWAFPGGSGVKCAVCGPLFPAMPFGRPTQYRL